VIGNATVVRVEWLVGRLATGREAGHRAVVRVGAYAREQIAKVGEGLDVQALAGCDQECSVRLRFFPLGRSRRKSQLPRPTTMGRRLRSAALLSICRSPSSV